MENRKQKKENQTRKTEKENGSDNDKYKTESGASLKVTLFYSTGKAKYMLLGWFLHNVISIREPTHVTFNALVPSPLHLMQPFLRR